MYNKFEVIILNYYERLRHIREDRDIKQETIAKYLGIQQTQYSRYERGIQMMGIDKYIKLAKYYNISLDYICGISDTPKELTENSTINKNITNIKGNIGTININNK